MKGALLRNSRQPKRRLILHPNIENVLFNTNENTSVMYSTRESSYSS